MLSLWNVWFVKLLNLYIYVYIYIYVHGGFRVNTEKPRVHKIQNATGHPHCKPVIISVLLGSFNLKSRDLTRELNSNNTQRSVAHVHIS